MMKTTPRSWTTIVTAITVLMVGEALTFLLAALLHLGIPFPLGFSEPRTLPAAIVEGLCGFLLAVSAYAVFACKTWAWGAALAAHIFAVAGVLLGITALALGRPPALRRTLSIIASSWGSLSSSWCCSRPGAQESHWVAANSPTRKMTRRLFQ